MKRSKGLTDLSKSPGPPGPPGPLALTALLRSTAQKVLRQKNVAMEEKKYIYSKIIAY